MRPIILVNLLLLTFSGRDVGILPGLLAEPFYALGIDTDITLIDVALIDDALSRQWDYSWAEFAGSGVGTSPDGVPGL